MPLSKIKTNSVTSVANTSIVGRIATSQLPTGSVLQVVQATYTTGFTTTSASFVDTGFSFSITPTSATSKILIIARVAVRSVGYAYGSLQFVRGASTILSPAPGNLYDTGVSTGDSDVRFVNSYMYLDSPSSTSLVTYKVQAAAWSNSTYYVYPNNAPASVIIMEIAV
jgi:hypothetical protein